MQEPMAVVADNFEDDDAPEYVQHQPGRYYDKYQQSWQPHKPGQSDVV